MLPLRFLSKRRLLIRSFVILVLLCFIIVITEALLYNQHHFKVTSATSIPLVSSHENGSINEDSNPGYTSYTVKRLGLKLLDGQVALDPKLGQVINDVMSFRYHIDVVHPHKCFQWTKESSGLLIVVVSAVGHSKRRQSIRRVLSKGGAGREWVFLVGSIPEDNSVTEKLLQEEKLHHNDIVQVDVIDSYANLTLKSVALLHWVHTHCRDADYVLKIDDDVFVNTKALSEIPRLFNGTKRHLYGTRVQHDKPQRSKDNKYYISRKVWPWKEYPDYLYGGGYFIGRDAVGPLLAAAQTTPYFPLEDVYLTGLCAWKANITHFRLPNKIYEPFIPSKLDPCFVRSTLMWQTQSHGQFIQSRETVTRIYRQDIQCGFTCKFLSIIC